VLFDGEEKSRLVSSANLEKAEVQVQPARASAESWMIVGTWDDWEPHQMQWNPQERRFEFTVMIGKDGSESFKLLEGGDWDRCLHPDRVDATLEDGHRVLGPDDAGLDEAWTMGREQNDRAAMGDRRIVVLTSHKDQKSVSWERLPGSMHLLAEQEAAANTARLAAGWKPPQTSDDVEAECRQRRERDEAEQIVAAERAARERLARRLEAASLPIEDESSTPMEAPDWEAKMRMRRMKDAQSRFADRYRRPEDPVPAEELQAEEEAPAQATSIVQNACEECGASTPYSRCSACLLLRVHQSTHQGTLQPARVPQQVAVGNARDAFDQFWSAASTKSDEHLASFRKYNDWMAQNSTAKKPQRPKGSKK